jgi:hypothetical protein
MSSFLHLPAEVAGVLNEVEVPGHVRERLNHICNHYDFFYKQKKSAQEKITSDQG